MSLTTDPNHPDLTRGNDTAPVPQAKVYLVLSEEERAKGFVRPYRDAYKHVGLAPKSPLRDLTPEEHQRYNVERSDGYVKFEPNPDYPEKSSIVGEFWTQAKLDTRGCGAVTTMGRALSETYARDPKFYGGTYCVKCAMHRPVAEFRWYEMDGTIGPVVGS
jgi:hypothetical protein